MCKNCINMMNDGWCEKVLDNLDKFKKRDCQYYKIMTNADRIRNMNNEELADFLVDTQDYYDDDYNEWLEWLKKAVEE